MELIDKSAVIKLPKSGTTDADESETQYSRIEELYRTWLEEDKDGQRELHNSTGMDGDRP